MDPKFAFAGLLVGFLIGLTGVGSGALLAPILIFLGIPPLAVIGSDLAYGLLTKLVGVGIHLRRQTVDWRWVGLLAAGSVPGALIGSLLLTHLAESLGGVRRWMGAVLIMTASIALLSELGRRLGARWASRMAQPRPWVISLIGMVIGLLVGSTSVGSGTLIDMALILFSPLSGATVVGTGMVHAIILSGTAAGAHWSLGNVNFHLVLNLLIGSVPGVLLGSQLAFRSPTQSLKLGIVTLVFISGLTMF